MTKRKIRLILRGLKQNKNIKPFVVSNKVKLHIMQKNPENVNLKNCQGDISGK